MDVTGEGRIVYFVIGIVYSTVKFSSLAYR